MANGLAIPVGVNGAGGAKILKGSKQKTKIVRSAFAEGDDNNPFQDLGLPPTMIFDINGDVTAGEARVEVETILSRLREQNNIEINPNKPIRVTREGEELQLEFEYIDLDLNETVQFNEFLRRAGGSTRV